MLATWDSLFPLENGSLATAVSKLKLAPASTNRLPTQLHFTLWFYKVPIFPEEKCASFQNNTLLCLAWNALVQFLGSAQQAFRSEILFHTRQFIIWRTHVEDGNIEEITYDWICVCRTQYKSQSCFSLIYCGRHTLPLQYASTIFSLGNSLSSQWLHTHTQ